MTANLLQLDASICLMSRRPYFVRLKHDSSEVCAVSNSHILWSAAIWSWTWTRKRQM